MVVRRRQPRRVVWQCWRGSVGGSKGNRGGMEAGVVRVQGDRCRSGGEEEMRDDGWKGRVEQAQDHGMRVVFRGLVCSSEDE